MKKILITGVTGSGKTTLVEKFKNENVTIFNEMVDEYGINEWYKKMTENPSKDNDFAKIMMLGNRLLYASNLLKNLKSGINIFDKGLFDLIIACELRIDVNFPEIGKLFHEEINKIIRENKNNLYDEVIILDIPFEVFKNRVILRNRIDEVTHINNSETWYQNYFHKYKKRIIELINNQNLKYTLIDTSDKTENEVFQIVKNLIYLN